MENINDENINNENIIVIIKKLLEKGDIERVSRIMTNFAIIERIDKKIYYVLQKMIKNIFIPF
jgi:hypothetical protein